MFRKKRSSLSASTAEADQSFHSILPRLSYTIDEEYPVDSNRTEIDDEDEELLGQPSSPRPRAPDRSYTLDRLVPSGTGGTILFAKESGGDNNQPNDAPPNLRSSLSERLQTSVSNLILSQMPPELLPKDRRKGVRMGLLVKNATQAVVQRARKRRLANASRLRTTGMTVRNTQLRSAVTAPAFFWTTPTGRAIVTVLCTAILCQRASVLLYGLLLIASTHLAWILLQWILYVLDDDDLHHLHRFAQVWGTLVYRSLWKVLHGQASPATVVWAGVISRQLPRGMSVARVWYRDYSHRANEATLREMQQYRAVKRPRRRNAKQAN